MKSNINLYIKILILILLCHANSYACMGIFSEEHILFKSIPKELSDAEFKGSVTIKKVSNIDNKQWLFLVVARVNKSETHTELESQDIVIKFKQTSCGPYVKVSEMGKIAGSITTDDQQKGVVIEPLTVMGDGRIIRNGKVIKIENPEDVIMGRVY